jgi:hypothetical protein
MMKKLLFLALLFSTQLTFATDYYVAVNGNDANPGTKSKPFATVQKAQSVVKPGETVFLRGGTYHLTEAQIAHTERGYACVMYMDKSGQPGKYINYFAYPGETPVFELSAVKPANLRVAAFYVAGDYIHFKGFEVTGVQVTIKTHTQSECFENRGNYNIYEQLKMHDSMAIGFYLIAGGNNLILNCDAFRNWDYFSENGRGGNSDGFGCHPAAGGKNNVFRGCRSWFNSDDGYDCINAHEATMFDHCWAFYNGYNKDFESEGDGNGFKAGGYARNPASRVANPVPQNTIQFCLSVRNKVRGFASNYHINGNFWYNNTAYKNAVNYDFTNRLLNEIYGDVPGYNHKVRNNLGFNGGKEMVMLDTTKSDAAYNYWNLNLTATADDFLSLDETQLTRPRKADGSLPDITFMHLKPNSQFVDKGQDIGFPYKGKAPDLGCFESGK